MIRGRCPYLERDYYYLYMYSILPTCPNRCGLFYNMYCPYLERDYYYLYMYSILPTCPNRCGLFYNMYLYDDEVLIVSLSH